MFSPPNSRDNIHWQVRKANPKVQNNEPVVQAMHHAPHVHKVRIHIDRKPYESPNPTTGEALYRLADVAAEHPLYQEVRGNQEDKLIHRNHDPVHLKEDEHFYSAEVHKREYAIIVNGRPKIVNTATLSFAEIVALGFDTPPTGVSLVFTVTYRRASGENGAKPDGTLVAGESVKIKDGTIFNVTATDKS